MVHFEPLYYLGAPRPLTLDGDFWLFNEVKGLGVVELQWLCIISLCFLHHLFGVPGPLIPLFSHDGTKLQSLRDLCYIIECSDRPIVDQPFYYTINVANI